MSAPIQSPFQSRKSLPFDLSTLGSDWRIEMLPKPHAVLNPAIEQSPNDQRKYRLLCLENGLEALLISDTTLDKAAASLSVGVGHLNDPDTLPGLAHFCEHMLFLGTEKFPDEAAYKTYLSQHAGSSNAYTSVDETNYHFSVHPTALVGALERHSQFFVAPLFLASCTERELNAVDSEFRRNLMLDSRRLFQLGKATTSVESGAKYWKFGTGSKQTLWEEPVARGIDVRDSLLEWYEDNYSANLMKLAVISTQSLDELTGLVTSRYSDIPNLNLAPPIFDAPVLTSKELKTMVSYRTIKDSPQLRLEFPFPDQREFWRSKPSRYLSHQIGHEGPGSILSFLKKKGWATSLSASGSGNGAPGFEFLRVSVHMTALGLKHHDEILQTIFSYIDLIRSEILPEWAFRENVALGEIGWKWKEHSLPEPTVTSLSSQLQSLYSRTKLLVGPYFPTEFSPELVKTLVDNLTPDRCRILVGSKDPLPGCEWNLTEKYYSTEYCLRALDLPALPNPNSSLALPLPNPFIPYNLELVPNSPGPDVPLKRPLLVRQTSSSRLFFKKDDVWFVPRARVHIVLSSPVAANSPASAIKTQMFAELAEEELAEQTYDAGLAGLGFGVGSLPQGLEITVGGYSEKLAALLEVVVNKLQQLPVDPTRFALIHDRLTRAYSNAKFDNPSTSGARHLSHITRQTHWTNEQRLQALEELKVEDITTHSRELLSAFNTTALVHGNLNKTDAVDILELVERKLYTNPVDPDKMDFLRGLLLPKGVNHMYRTPVFSPDNVNNAAIVFYECAQLPSDHDVLVRLKLFAQIAKVPVFATLRTKEQLGYIVQSSVRTSRGVSGFQVVVQSERTAEYLEERIEALWDSFGEFIDEMSEEDFSKQRQSLINQRLEKPKNLGQETSRYWAEIEGDELDFFYREREAELISDLTKDDIKSFFKSYIHSSPTRTKLSILMRSQRFQPNSLQPLLDALETTVSEDGLSDARALAQTKPTLPSVTSFLDALFPNGLPHEVEVVVSALRTLPPVAGVKEIEDLEKFRQSLSSAERVVPVHTFERDIVARL